MQARMSRTHRTASFATIGGMKHLLAGLVVASLLTARAGEEEDLVGVLKSDAAPAAKCDACTRLKIVGTAASVPALAGLLADERMSQAARNALETMPGPEAGAALREALGKTAGLARVGVIDSLGRRRDDSAVPGIAPLLGDADVPTATAAAAALGRIGSPEALSALTAARNTAPEAVRPVVRESLLQCAEHRLAAGDPAGATAIGRSLLDAGAAPHLRAAAWQLVVAADAPARTAMVADALTGADRPLRVAALGWLREAGDMPLVQAVLARWDALPAEAQLAAMDAHLRLGGDAGATVRKAAASPHAMVRRAAWAALANLKDAGAVAPLARAAAGGEADDREAAREALSRIHGPGVREALLAHAETAAAAEKAEVLAAFGLRGDKDAVDVLLRHAGADDEAVRAAALKSLRTLAAPGSLAPLLDLATKAPSPERRAPLIQVLQAVCQAAPDKGAATKSVLDAFGPLAPAGRAPFLALLPVLGTAEALAATRDAAASDNPALAAEGVRTLARWPDTSAATALLDRARSSADPSVRMLAARGVIDLAGREPDAAKRLDLLRQALEAASRPDEKRQALGLIGAIHTPAALDVAVAALADAAVAEEAGLAVVTIAEKLATAQPKPVAEAAAKVVERCKAAGTVRRAQALASKPSPSPAPAPTPAAAPPAAVVVPAKLPARDAFKTLRLSEEFFAEGAYHGDFNRDGKPDVVAGPFWFEGPSFEKRHEYRPAKAFDPKGYSDNFLTYSGDFDGDGWCDILCVPFPGIEGYWYRNPAGRGDAWTKHVVFSPIGNESPVWGDVTGDGRAELIFCGDGLYGFAGPDPAKPTEPWPFRAVSNKDKRYFKFTHGAGFGDINGDGRTDLVEAIGWWEQPANAKPDQPWPFHEQRFAEAAAQILVGDVDGDKVADVITAWHCHHYGLVWWRQVRKADGAVEWQKNTILTPTPDTATADFRPSQLHAFELVDMNGDGVKDILTGKRFWAHGPKGDKEPDAPAVVFWLETRRDGKGGATFVPHLIDDNSGVGTQVAAADLNGDGRPDVIVANKKGIFVHLSERR